MSARQLPLQEKRELCKVIQPLPLVGMGSAALHKGTKAYSGIQTLTDFQQCKLPRRLCDTSGHSSCPALLSRWWRSEWPVPDSPQHSAWARRQKSYGFGQLRFSNSLRPRAGQIQTSPQDKSWPMSHQQSACARGFSLDPMVSSSVPVHPPR